MSIAVSKITRGGQITLPKKIRESGAFVGAHAVVFERDNNEVTIRPVRVAKRKKVNEHLSITEWTMRDWALEVHDDLFEIPRAT